MAKANSTRASANHASTESAALLVPRFVHNLNAIAAAAGFSIEGNSVGKFHKNDDHQSIITTWRGSRAALRALTFLPLSIRERGHISDSGVTVSWPDSPWSNPIFLALCRTSCKGIELAVNGGPLPKMIRHQGDLEIIEYDNGTAYHGTKQALIAAGICDGKRLPGKQWSKSIPYSAPDTDQKWRAKRHPDGMFVYWLETEEACKRRNDEYKAYTRQQSSSVSIAEQSHDKGCADVDSIEVFRRVLKGLVSLSMINGNVVSILNDMERLKGKNEYIYGITRESRGRIEDAINELLSEFQQAEIYRVKFDARTDEEKAAARGLLANAESDTAFQRFISQLPIGRQQS